MGILKDYLGQGDAPTNTTVYLKLSKSHLVLQ